MDLKRIDLRHNLTAFQVEFLTKIEYFTNKKGSFILYNDYWKDKYKEIVDSETFDKEIEDLLIKGIINKTTKKEIFNYKWVTKSILKINYSVLYYEDYDKLIKHYKDIMEKQKKQGQYKNVEITESIIKYFERRLQRLINPYNYEAE